MNSRILVGVDSKFKLEDSVKTVLEKFGPVETVDCNNLLSAFQKIEAPDVYAALLPYSLQANQVLSSLPNSHALATKTVWLKEPNLILPENASILSTFPITAISNELIASLLLRAFDPTRASGAKSLLSLGSTVYTESFSALEGMGTKLDPCNSFALSHLQQANAGKFWTLVNALVAEGITSCSPEVAKRVELQLGADQHIVCASMRFPTSSLSLTEIYKKFSNPKVTETSLWSLAKALSNFVEIRYFSENNSSEIIITIQKSQNDKDSEPPMILRTIPSLPLENTEEVSKYKFKQFASITLEKKSGAIGFRKKNSTEEANAISDRKDEASSVSPGANQNTEDSEVQELRTTLKQREELIKKLNKEIAEINDPLKRGAISSVMDNQQKALMQNVSRLEGELKDADKREKEMMSMVDKAIQQKDEAVKKMKALETKLSQAEQGNNTQVVKLTKQLEEANKQKKLLSEKLMKLTNSEKKAS